MNKLFLFLTLILIVFISTTINSFALVDKEKETETNTPPKNHNQAQATYILQVSSNLACNNLDIELKSGALNSTQHIHFTTSAYSAVTLPQGDYSFGEVICTNTDGRQTFDVLTKNIHSFTLKAGGVYYGGRLIFKKVNNTDAHAESKVINNCTNVMSKARGESSNECRDGVGVKDSPRNQFQIDVFAPEVTDKNISVVSSALSIPNEQLLYSPIVYKKSQ